MPNQQDRGPDGDMQANEIDPAAAGDDVPNATDPGPVVNEADDAGSVDQCG